MAENVIMDSLDRVADVYLKEYNAFKTQCLRDEFEQAFLDMIKDFKRMDSGEKERRK